MHSDILATAFFTFVVAFIIGALAGFVHAGGGIKKQAIERGYALYCPTTGKWAWKGECDQ